MTTMQETQDKMQRTINIMHNNQVQMIELLTRTYGPLKQPREETITEYTQPIPDFLILKKRFKHAKFHDFAYYFLINRTAESYQNLTVAERNKNKSAYARQNKAIEALKLFMPKIPNEPIPVMAKEEWKKNVSKMIDEAIIKVQRFIIEHPALKKQTVANTVKINFMQNKKHYQLMKLYTEQNDINIESHTTVTPELLINDREPVSQDSV